MSGGTNGIMTKLRDVIEKGGNLDVNTRDVLLFSAIIDIYEQYEQTQKDISAISTLSDSSIAAIKESTKNDLAAIRKDMAPALVFTQVGVWVAGIVGSGMILFAGALLTGQIEVIVR